VEKNKTMPSKEQFEKIIPGDNEQQINSQTLINEATGLLHLLELQKSELDNMTQTFKRAKDISDYEVLLAAETLKHGVEHGVKMDNKVVQSMADIAGLTKKLAEQAINNNQSNNSGGGGNSSAPKIEVEKENKNNVIDDKQKAIDLENKKIAQQGSMIVDPEKGKDKEVKSTDNKPKDLAEEARKNIENGENQLSNDIIQALASGKNLTRTQMLSMRKVGIMRKVFQKLREQKRDDLVYSFLVSLFITSKLRKNPKYSKKDSLNLLNRVLKINKKTPISQSFAGSFRLASLGNKLTIDNIKQSVSRNAGKGYKELHDRLISGKIFTADQLKEIKTKSVPALLFMTAGLTANGSKIANSMNSDEMNFQDAGERYTNFMQALIRSCDMQSQDFQKIRAGIERDGKRDVGNGEIVSKLIKRYEEQALGLSTKNIQTIMGNCLARGERTVVKNEPEQNNQTIDFIGLQYVVDKEKRDNDPELYEIDGQEFTADQVELLAVRMAEEGKIPESVALAHIKAGGVNPYEIIAELKAIKDHVYDVMLDVNPREKSNKKEFGQDSLLKEEDQNVQKYVSDDKIDDIESQDRGLEDLTPNVLSKKPSPEDRGGIEDFDNIVSKLLDDTFRDSGAESADQSELQNRVRNPLDIDEDVESVYDDNYSTDVASEVDGKIEELSIEEAIEEQKDIETIMEEDIIEEIVEEDIIEEDNKSQQSFAEIEKLKKQSNINQAGI
jgi:hypothetical protein